MDLGARDMVTASSKESSGRMDPDSSMLVLLTRSALFLVLPIRFRSRFPLSFSGHCEAREIRSCTDEKMDKQARAISQRKHCRRSGSAVSAPLPSIAYCTYLLLHYRDLQELMVCDKGRD